MNTQDKTSALSELSRLRDEILLKLKLGGMEAKDYWKQDLEPKLEHLEDQLASGGEKMAETTERVFSDVGKRLREFAERLRAH